MNLKAAAPTSVVRFPPAVSAALALYDLSWWLFSPVLRFNKRLLEGWDQRRLKAPLPSADLWFHAASAGEAYLAGEVVRTLKPCDAISILVTTHTRQGLEILSRVKEELQSHLMKSAVAMVCPRLMILLETELWPGLLSVLKTVGIPSIMLNGRINPTSLRRYMHWPVFWRSLAPDQIAAISQQDADRFQRLFTRSQVAVMPNIKFDQWYRQLKLDAAPSRLESLFSRSALVAVFGSIRKQEEKEVQAMIARIFSQLPDTIVALFPRHMNRFPAT